MREQRLIRRTREAERDGVLEDKINGNALEVVNEFKHLEHRVKNYDASLMRNSSDMKSLLMTFAEKEKLEMRSGRGVLDGNKAEKIEKVISKSLKKALGHDKGKKVAKKFLFQAKEYGIEKASENLIKEVSKSSRRHSGRKIGSFARKTGALSKVSKRSSIKKIERQEKLEKIMEAKKLQAMRVGGKEGQKLASMIDKKMSNTKGGIGKASAQIEKLKQKGSIEKRIEKAFEKQEKLISVREAAVRRLRRTARKLRTASRNIQEVSRANNGIHLNDRGEHASEGLQNMINDILQYANESDLLRTSSVSVSRASSKTMMVDALLQKGRASMMAATRRTNVMRKNLIKEKQLDQDRVRS